jgi:hypothetical protein
MCVLILLHIRQQGVASDAVANSSSSPQRNHEQSQKVGRQKKEVRDANAHYADARSNHAAAVKPLALLALRIQHYLLCVTLCAVRNFFKSQSPI